MPPDNVIRIDEVDGAIRVPNGDVTKFSTLGRKTTILQLPQHPKNPSEVIYNIPNGSLYISRSRSTGIEPPILDCSRPTKIAHCQLTSIKYATVDDQFTNEKKLTVTIRLSAQLRPNDILVKANKNGNKIRVVTNRDSTSSSLSNEFEINEQLSLPVEVDPYRLMARLDQNGNLLVEAPIVG